MSRVRSQLTFANVVSCLALFVALGGSAYALEVNSVGTKQLKDRAVTSSKLANNAVTSSKLANNSVTTGKLANNAVTNSKLANNAVTNSKLANNAVTSAKVADGSLTAADIAPNTFLAATGTAVDSGKLGGLLPADFVQGVGIMSDRRLVVPAGSSLEFLNTLFGTFTGACDGSGKLSVTWSPTVSNAEFLAQIVQFPNTVSVDTVNAIPAGGSISEPSTPSAGPMSITFQIAYTSGLDHVATAFVTGRFESGVGCVFTGQELSST